MAFGVDTNWGMQEDLLRKKILRKIFRVKTCKCNCGLLVNDTMSNSLVGRIIYVFNAWAVWKELSKRFEKIYGLRTFNLHKDNTLISQGTSSIYGYFTKLQSL